MAQRPSDGVLDVTTGYYGRAVQLIDAGSRTLAPTWAVGGVPGASPPMAPGASV